MKTSAAIIMFFAVLISGTFLVTDTSAEKQPGLSSNSIQNTSPLGLWNSADVVIDGTVIDVKHIKLLKDVDVTFYKIKVNEYFKGFHEKTELLSPKKEMHVTEFDVNDNGLFYLKSEENQGYVIQPQSIKTFGNCNAQDLMAISLLLPNGEFPHNVSAREKSYFDSCSADYLIYDVDFFNGILHGISPLKQTKKGIPSDLVHCYDDLLKIPKHDGSAACVTPQTAQKLDERKWTQSTKDKITVSFSFCGADGHDSHGNLNKSNSTHTWNENHCEWTKNDPSKYSETITDNNPYNNELIIFQKDNFGSLQYDKTQQVIDETFLSKTAGEWQKVSWDVLMDEHEKYLPEHKFFDHLGSFLIKNEFQNIMNELGIVNADDDFVVKGGMSLTSLPPHNSYYSIIKATDGNYYRLQGGTHANEVSVSKVSALLFFDTSVDFKMEDLVSENQLFTILPENNNKPEIDPSNLIIHTNNSKVEFYNNTPEIIRIQDSGTGRVGEEHLLDWVGPTILPYTTASMTFDEPGNFDFNVRFAPNLENPLWWSTHTSGTIIVMSEPLKLVFPVMEIVSEPLMASAVIAMPLGTTGTSFSITSSVICTASGFLGIS